jgi:hypothetical protein
MRSSRAGLSVAVLLLFPLMYAGVARSQGENRDPVILGFEAVELAEDTGITVDEAYDAIMRQPRIGQLQAAMYERGPKSFGGLYVDYQPEYSITTLATPRNGSAVREAVGGLGFSDLAPFISVRETVLTEAALQRAQVAIARNPNSNFTWTDVDLVAGAVDAAVASEKDVQPARDRIRRADLGGVPPERIKVLVGGHETQDSYGGLVIEEGTQQCTTGFTVLHSATNVEGVATAGHCYDNQRLGHHSDVDLGYRQAEKIGDNQDLQWYKTPNLDDKKEIRYADWGGIRPVNSRTGRDVMFVGETVCKWGQASGDGCGQIKGRSFDPDDIMDGPDKYSETFIRMENVDTMKGDSGGPWFSGYSAYGIHTGSSFSNWDMGIPAYPYFMAQNYTAALGLVVRVTGD